MGRPKKYQTEEERKEYYKKYYQEHKEERLEYQRQYNQEHKEENAEYMKLYYQENKEKYTERNKQCLLTPMGRAYNLLQAYKRLDKKYNRGECTIPNAQWIVDNIFTKKCAHCGKTDWRELGCNRLDNSLPHTPDNVEPCCGECNVKLPGRTKKRRSCDPLILN